MRSAWLPWRQTHAGSSDGFDRPPTNMKCAEGARYALAVVPATADAVTRAAGTDPSGPFERSWETIARAQETIAAVVDAAAGLLTLRNLVAVLAVVGAAALGWALLKAAATRRGLRPERRVRLVALPSETFDPAGEEVDRFAAQLSRTRRSVRGSLDRPAQAVRLQLDSVGNGRCVYRIEGSARAASVLQLPGYAQVELRPAEAIDVEALDCLGHTTAAASGDTSVHPLGEASGAADPLDTPRPARDGGQEDW